MGRSGELEKVKGTITNIQDPVSKMIQKFRTSKIGLSVAEGKIYDETTTFNEQNINEYLAEVEEYIKCLLAFVGKQLGFEHPMLAALGLDDLPRKIEPPVFPKEGLLASDEEEEPDDATLNDMLDKGKFDRMMVDLLEKRKEASKSMMQAEESKLEEGKLSATEVKDISQMSVGKEEKAPESKAAEEKKEPGKEEEDDEEEKHVLGQEEDAAMAAFATDEKEPEKTGEEKKDEVKNPEAEKKAEAPKPEEKKGSEEKK